MPSLRWPFTPFSFPWFGLASGLALASCAGDHESMFPVDDTELVGIWEARVEKPFERDDPEQYTFKISSRGEQLEAYVCTLRRVDGVFEGNIESFQCDTHSVPVRVDSDSATIGWPDLLDPDVRLTLTDLRTHDSLAGDAFVKKWAEAGATHFTAIRIDPALLP